MIEYRLKKPFSFFLPHLGFTAQMEIPVNVILDYQLLKIPGFYMIGILVNKFSFGQKAPLPRRLGRVFILRNSKRVFNLFNSLVEKNIEATCNGTNIGLAFLDKTEVLKYYWKTDTQKQKVIRIDAHNPDQRLSA